MDISAHRQNVALALRRVEERIAQLVDALAHRPVWLKVEGASSDRLARQHVCSAYASIDYGMQDAVGTSIVCLGVAGVSSEILKRAEQVNDAKAALKKVCAPLQRLRTRVPVKGEGGTRAIPLIRMVLRSIQRSDLNLLAAYRYIPILDAPPVSVTYTRAHTRAVYRKSVDEIYSLLMNIEGPVAEVDRARLSNLNRNERFLALARPHYDNIRANIVYAHLDARGRGRVQCAAQIPLLYATGRRHTPPEVTFPANTADAPASARRPRQSILASEPLLRSIPVFRIAVRRGALDVTSLHRGASQHYP